MHLVPEDTLDATVFQHVLFINCSSIQGAAITLDIDLSRDYGVELGLAQLRNTTVISSRSSGDPPSIIFLSGIQTFMLKTGEYQLGLKQ